MKYYVINTVTLDTLRINSAKSVAAQMLGRKIKNYVIVKSDENGNRIYTPTNADVTVIEMDLEAL